jgi:hypothetical protein
MGKTGLNKVYTEGFNPIYCLTDPYGCNAIDITAFCAAISRKKVSLIGISVFRATKISKIVHLSRFPEFWLHRVQLKWDSAGLTELLIVQTTLKAAPSPVPTGTQKQPPQRKAVSCVTSRKGCSPFGLIAK